MIYVKAGTGIGGCLVSGGQIYRGGRGLSGDVTHVRVADSGERHCSCGSRGCLETVASGAALARQLASNGLCRRPRSGISWRRSATPTRPW